MVDDLVVVGMSMWFAFGVLGVWNLVGYCWYSAGGLFDVVNLRVGCLGGFNWLGLTFWLVVLWWCGYVLLRG